MYRNNKNIFIVIEKSEFTEKMIENERETISVVPDLHSVVVYLGSDVLMMR